MTFNIKYNETNTFKKGVCSMRIDPIDLNHNKFVSDYRNQTNQIKTFFEYNPFTSYKERLSYLDKNDYQREELTKILQEMNVNWDADESSLKNIDRLKSEDAVVVIGCPLSGLHTVPLYSIIKVIYIISLSFHQEAELNRPVIPVFCIAGEEHDFDEINHVNIRTDNGIKKHTSTLFTEIKKSITQIDIDS